MAADAILGPAHDHQHADAFAGPPATATTPTSCSPSQSKSSVRSAYFTLRHSASAATVASTSAGHSAISCVCQNAGPATPRADDSRAIALPGFDTASHRWRQVGAGVVADIQPRNPRVAWRGATVRPHRGPMQGRAQPHNRQLPPLHRAGIAPAVLRCRSGRENPFRRFDRPASAEEIAAGIAGRRAPVATAADRCAFAICRAACETSRQPAAQAPKRGQRPGPLMRASHWPR